MGTTLTGTKPKDTYDSLIKVGDNGPISGTAKTLSDGLGNDLPISVSTSNVGIGTSTASRLLTLKNNAGATNGISFQSLATTAEIAAIECNQTLDTIDIEMLSNFAGNGVRFLTGTPTLVERARFTANGLTFNGDTAAANALDDYEEGTWTMGVAFGGASVGVTYANNTGTYTKIGRQVTVNGYLYLTSKGSSTGDATITGLPYVIANTASNYSTANFAFSTITFANQFQGFGVINTTTIKLEEITALGTVTSISNADFANNSYIVLSFTYFV
jgi:hypothetical protein